jgi:transcriptional regulator with XRE-family HTH domain
VTFGEELRAAREAAGLTQTELAERIGMSGNHLSNVEHGRKNASFEMVDKLEEILGTRFNVVSPKDVPEAEPTFTSKDEAPRPRKGAAPGPRKKSGPTGIPSLRVQLEMPYRLGATALAGRLPVTAGVMNQQAGPCAEAWDVFLLRYPKLREKIEQGAVAADIVNLVMAHVPIIQVAREEIAAQQLAATQTYDGGLGTQAA